jgi:hypothetical protein
MVPQDVEADDKLVGFLSLKQFIMTVVGIGFGYLTFFFFTKIHPLASLIWLPPTLVFLVLGLYQRKDQPIEVFLASALTFYFKPRTRIWSQEGHEDHVIITAPPKVEHHYTKDFSGEEAASRLAKLSIMMDSRGWASKQMADWQNPNLVSTADSNNRLVHPQEAPGQVSVQQTYMQPADIMDSSTSLVARDFDNRISQVETSNRTHAMEVINKARAEAITAPQSQPDIGIQLPKKHSAEEIHEKVIEPPQVTDSVISVPPVDSTKDLSQRSGVNAGDQPAQIETEVSDEAEITISHNS